MNSCRGFSLVELIVVMVIVSLVAAVAIPGLILSRLAKNEAAAVAACRTIAGAEAAYAKTHEGKYAYLEELAEAGLLGGRGLDGLARNYSFSAGDVIGSMTAGTPPESYGFIATPSAGHGRYMFAVGPDRTVRYLQAAPGFSLPADIHPGDPVEGSGEPRKQSLYRPPVEEGSSGTATWTRGLWK